MDKCREEFERSKTFKYFYSVLMHFDEELNCYSSSNSLRVRDAELLTAAWWAFQEQQAKVEGLQKQLNEYMFVAETIDEMYVKEVQKSDELQKRVEWLEDRLKATDTLSKMRAAVIGSFNSQEFNARTRRKMMILKRAEQALKGEGQ
ncbi:hypothetical protein [Acinetobacter baumannii]|uniref:hypothetical protein n=1 Tax=Acinetobacter baumannii TaxID=470 RepID=UPI0035CFC874